MKRALVTGGAGFIGTHLVRRLLVEGVDVVVLDDLSSGKREKVPEEARLQVGSVLDAAAVSRSMEGVDTCFHLAAIASVERCNEDLVAAHKVNVTGWVTVIQEARHKSVPPNLVYASSAAVYGANQDVPLKESTPVAPLSAYGADKYACELHALAAHHVYGLPSSGFRFFNVYGPGQDPSSPYSGVISRFADRLQQGAPVSIFGDGKQSRDFVYVEDVVEALLRGATLGPDQFRVLNVCTGVECSVRELAETMAGIFEQELRINEQPPRKGEVRRSLGSSAALFENLGFTPSTPLALGLARLRGSSF